jgi:hypothetical protein
MGRMLRSMVLLCAAGAAYPATLQQLTMDEMTRSATAIVRARVSGALASFTGSTIYTHYKLEVTETWKGSAGSEVMLPGGIASGYRQSFPGVPKLETGAEYVLFLWKSPAGITHLVGLSQGLFQVTSQPDGLLAASRPQIGETMLDASGKPVRDQALQMKLADMKTRVSQALAAGVQK